MNTNFYTALTNPVWQALLAISCFAVAFFLTAQYVFDLEPCKMCYWQRYPWYTLAVISCIVIFAPRLRMVFGLVSTAILIIGGSIGTYHAGVEYGWWPGLSTCASNLPSTDNIEELRALLIARDFTPCDKAPWTMFYISMAGYNALVSYGLSAVLLYWQFFSKAKALVLPE